MVFAAQGSERLDVPLKSNLSPAPAPPGIFHAPNDLNPLILRDPSIFEAV